MEQLPRLQARIASLDELRDLIRALRALAASHMQESLAALLGIRGYVAVVEDAIAAVADLLPDTDGQAAAFGTAEARVLIAVCSEHGFAGAFNERLLDCAESELRQGYQLGIIGRRGAATAEERKMEASWSFPMATHVGGVPAVTRRAVSRLADVAEADIIFARHTTSGGFEVEKKAVLPLDPALLVGSRQRSPPLHQLSPDVLLQRLAGEYLFAEIARALMESLASENDARLLVMQSADHSIGDKLEELRRLENALRQESITSELLDVVTGAQAVLDSPLGRAR